MFWTVLILYVIVFEICLYLDRMVTFFLLTLVMIVITLVSEFFNR